MRSKYFKPLSVIFISCLGIIVYSNTFHCAFHLDDVFFITDNPAIKNISDLQSIWNFLPCRFIFYYSMALNYYFNGLEVFGYHLVNLMAHIISAILVWWLVLLTLSTPALNEGTAENNNAIKKKASAKSSRNLPNLKLPQEGTYARHAELFALFVALLFVSHPIQTQGVTYIMQRAASMASLFYLASLCFYVKSRLLQTSGSSKYYYISSLIMAIAAMFTKEIVITLPLMILLYEFCFFKNKGKFNWGYLIPFLLIIFIIPVTMLLTKSANAMSSREMNSALQGTTNISTWHYLLTQFRVIVTYVRLLFLPLNQNLDYDYSISNSLFEFPTLLSFLFLIGIFYFAVRLFSKYRLISFSIFWFFLTLLPESSLFPIKDVIFEHRLYLPLVGFSLFLVSGAHDIFGKDNFKKMLIVLSMVIVCNSVLTYQRNKIWIDESTLWNDAILKSPQKARPYSYRGLDFFNHGDIDRSLSDYNKALGIDPKDVQTYNNRGNTYGKLGRLTEALSDYTKAIDLGAVYAQIYYNRAVIYNKQGKLDQAISDYNKAIEINPVYLDAYLNRATAYAQQGRFEEALSDFNKVIEFNPKDPQTYYDLGLIYSRQGNNDQAILEYTKAIEIDPNYADAYNNQAVSYYQLKEYVIAWRDVQKAEELGYAVNPGFLHALKEALGQGE